MTTLFTNTMRPGLEMPIHTTHLLELLISELSRPAIANLPARLVIGLEEAPAAYICLVWLVCKSLPTFPSES